MTENIALRKYQQEHEEALNLFVATCDLDPVIAMIVNGLRNGKTVYAFGNGGSAADASHFIAELVGRFELNRGPYCALCLNSDHSLMTAIANDYGYDNVFSRQVEGLVKEGDVVIGFSTSGQSRNVMVGLTSAISKGAYVISFTGYSKSNDVSKLADLNVHVPSSRTSIVQEIHHFATHYIAGRVEKELQ